MIGQRPEQSNCIGTFRRSEMLLDEFSLLVNHRIQTYIPRVQITRLARDLVNEVSKMKLTTDNSSSTGTSNTSPEVKTHEAAGVHRGVLKQSRESSRHYLVLAYFALLGWSASLISVSRLHGLRDGLYSLSLVLTYSLIYLLPTIVLVLFTSWMLAKTRSDRLKNRAILGVTILGTTLTFVLLFSDTRIYEIYGFHINGFVVNLLFTRGGLESLGFGASTVRSVALGVSVLVCLEIFTMWILTRPATRQRIRRINGPSLKLSLCLLALLSLGERLAWGVGHLTGHVTTLATAEGFPFHARLTIRSLAKKFGVEPTRSSGIDLALEGIGMNYPEEPVQLVENPPSPNIVILAVESLRADMLTPEIMPSSTEFAKGSLRFENHFSGGNCTRMGVFSLFYGLYGSYWFPCLEERRGPILIDLLLERGYAMRAHTSAHFTYPEFDKTVFAKLPAESMHEYPDGYGWERDRQNIDDLSAWLEAQSPDQPFFAFSFLESPHARYWFPEESIIRRPYLEDFDYATMNLERDIELIRNRYINASHHLDSQLDRIYRVLERNGLLENTIVVVTGDHGEEFLEKGRWGHGSSFSEEQIRVPLILRVPGGPTGNVTRMSSHLDIADTLMRQLGVTNAASSLSLGNDLLGGKERTSTVVADWSRVAYRDDEYKLVLPIRGPTWRSQETTATDDALPEGVEISEVRPQAMLKLLDGLSRFTRRTQK